MPVRRPEYNNARIADFQLWYRDNEPRLTEYYESLGAWVHEVDDDFFSFAITQHDMEANKERTDG
jgi:hypothetical protein